MELFKQLKIWNFHLIWKKMALYRKLLNFDLYEKKNTENNKTFTMEKTMVMYQKLLNFDLLWGKNMALIKPKTVEL